MRDAFTYEELYPIFDPTTDGYQMPGESLIGDENHVSVLAFRMGYAAMENKGTNCPCCGQHVQIYGRVIYKKMAGTINGLVREFKRRIEEEGNDDWVNLKDVSTDRGGDSAKLVYWSLMVKHPTRSSYYKPTQIADWYVVGLEKRDIPPQIFQYFVRAPGQWSTTPTAQVIYRLTLPKYAYVYDGQVLGYSTERQTWDEAANTDFDKYDLEISPS